MAKRLRPALAYQHPRAPIRVLADEARPKLRRGFKEALRLPGSLFDKAKAAYLIRAGRLPEVGTMVDWDHYREAMRAPLGAVADVWTEGGKIGSARINRAFATKGQAVRFRKAVADGTYGAVLILEKDFADQFSYDRFDPQTQERIRAYQDAFITGLENDARSMIDAILIADLRAGMTAEEIADDIVNLIGLTDRQAVAVANYRRMVEGLDPAALSRQLAGTADGARLRAAIDAGQPLDEAAVDAMVERYRQATLDYRAQMIAQTEATRAASLGLQDSYQQAIDRGAIPAEAITQHWEVDMDEHTCLPAGTLVATPGGNIAIERLRVGDGVLTRKGERKLRAVMTRQTTKTIVVLHGGDGFVLSATCDHPILVGGRWRDAGEIKPGDALHGVNDQPIFVRRVAHIEFSDPHHMPVLRGKASIAPRILHGIAMPELSVHLDGDHVGGDSEVDQIAADFVFLLKRNPASQGEAHSSLWQCFPTEPTIAAERAKLSGGLARRYPKGRAAGSAISSYGWASALFAAVLAAPARILNECLATCLTRAAYRDGQAALTGTHGITGSVTLGHAEQDTATRTTLGYFVAAEREMAFPRTEFGSVAQLRWGWVKGGPASYADGGLSRPDTGARLESHLARILGGGHVLESHVLRDISNENALWVYDLEVDDEHEFFANGALVHNCSVCLSIVDANPDGVPFGESFDSEDGPIDAPPAHVGCRCSITLITNLDLVPE